MTSTDNLLTPTPSAYTYPLLIKQLLINAMSLHGDQEISYRAQMRYSYRDFRNRIGQLANALTALEVHAGSTVAVMDWDSHRYLESYFGIPMMGATLFTVNVRLSPAQILYTLNDADADVLLVHTDFLPVIEEIRSQLPRIRHIVVLSDDGVVPACKLEVVGEYEALVCGARVDYDFPELDENTKAVTFYTTGTTGDPKGVCYSHRHIVMHTLTAALSLCSPMGEQRLHRGDVYMPITPMFHVLGWGVPYIAMSETGPVVSLALAPTREKLSAPEDLRLRTSTGKPSLLVDFRVVDEEMKDVPRDGMTRGEIVLRSPSLTPIYFKKPEASQELWRGGYLHTQDIAVMHADGMVQIVDRLKDVIKTGGEWVSSIEVESLITQVPGVSEAAVIGVPDAKWGERPMAFVVAAADVKPEFIREQLQAHVQAKRISAYAVPELERICLVAQIPKTSVGKINKKLLREAQLAAN